MEELAKKMLYDINMLCINFHYFRKTDVFDKIEQTTENIQQFTNTLIRGIQKGEIDDRDAVLQEYVVQILNDYMEAIQYRDSVLMLDTLDYGLRELLNIFAEEKNGEDNESGSV